MPHTLYPTEVPIPQARTIIDAVRSRSVAPMKAEVAKCVWEIQGYALLNTLGEPDAPNLATSAAPLHDDVTTAIQELHDHVAGIGGIPVDQHPQAAQFPGGAWLVLALIKNILPYLLRHHPAPPAPPAPGPQLDPTPHVDPPPAPPPSNELPPEVATA
jgi:hypothetical protein